VRATTLTGGRRVAPGAALRTLSVPGLAFAALREFSFGFIRTDWLHSGTNAKGPLAARTPAGRHLVSLPEGVERPGIKQRTKKQPGWRLIGGMEKTQKELLRLSQGDLRQMAPAAPSSLRMNERADNFQQA